MATLASRSPHPAPLSASHNGQYRPLAPSLAQGVFTSPTKSEFSESYETYDAIRRWDEFRVSEWLRSIDCAQYVEVFRQNNINGENLMEMDRSMLKDMCIKRIGDRVRIATQAKQFRNSAYRKTSMRSVNRHSLAVLDSNAVTPPSSASTRTIHARAGGPLRSDKRMSRRFDASDIAAMGKASRPGSPMIDENKHPRSQRYPGMSPMESMRREQNSSHFHSGSNAKGGSKSTPTPLDTPPMSRSHIKSSPSFDNLVTKSNALPVDKALIRVIYDNGITSVVNIEGCRTADDIMLKTLKKQALNEAHLKNYCFYILNGTRPDPAYCRRLGDTELVRICGDRRGGERGRLILRKIHAGEPEGEQLRVAAKIAEQDAPPAPDIDVQRPPKALAPRRLKAEEILGESLPSVTYPMSPASKEQRECYFQTEREDLGRTQSNASTASARARKLRDFLGQRPPTELITQDLTSYFPDVEKKEMDRTVLMSVRRSRRLSRAASRMSTASNLSFAASLRDAPPLPTIADTWLNGGSSGKSMRPLSVVRLGRPQSHYRDSMASSVLERLDEEATLEPSRRSYVSFGEGSGSDSNGGTNNTLSGSDPTGTAILNNYYDEFGNTPPSTLNNRLSRFVAEDGEEEDKELMEHLEKDSWEDLKYMKGSMIGQGSFGTVYLALHAITGELMALKQVEMPSSANTAVDAKKNNMVEALKREIDLLRELKHANIVQYLGSNSDESHLNIFLEYVAGGSVATMLINYGSLPEPLISNFVRQILNGLAYLHSKDIIHRDIKGANILVDNHGSVKISDFGISKRVESTLRTSTTHQLKRGGPRVSLQGSVFWMAPEVVKQTAYTRKADIWSLGCLIVEMFTGSHPHPNCTQLQAIFKIGGSGEARPDTPASASKEARTFLERTFEYNHENRPSAEELLKFGFVAGLS